MILTRRLKKWGLLLAVLAAAAGGSAQSARPGALAKPAAAAETSASLAVTDASLDALAEAGHWKRLRAILEPRLKTNPNDAQANYLFSNLRDLYDDLDGMLSYAEKAAALDPKRADYRCQVAEAYGEKANKASIFSRFGLARRFKKEAEAANALDSKSIGCRWALMEFHMRAPGIVGGDKNVAKQMVQEILQIDPARGQLAEARRAQLENKDTPVESFYLKALEANPKSYRVQMTLSSFYFSGAQKKLDLAEKHSREALKIDPGRAGAYSQLSAVFAVQERWTDLDTILVQSEKNVPDNLNPFYQAGRQLIDAGKDLPRAEKYFRKYLSQEPEPNAPSLGAGHWRLGQVLEKMGRKAESVSEYETAVRLDPKLEQAKKDLKRLK